MSIQNKKGDLLSADCIIRCHQVNCKGDMGAGIAKQVKEKYPEAFAPYQGLCKQFGSKLLGEVQFIPCHDGTLIANLFAQDDYGAGKVQTDMVALEECLTTVFMFASKTGASVGFPRLMGADRGGGDWVAIEALIRQLFDTPERNCVIVEWDPPTEKAAKPPAKPRQKKPKIIIHTDGSCLGNPGPGGWACILESELGIEKEFSGGATETTNNRMELTAVIEALKNLKVSCKCELYTDSAYVVNSINKGWLADWKKAGWTKKSKGEVVNLDLWKELDKLLPKHDIDFIWVKGHAYNEGNNRCDKLAQQKAKSFR